VVKISKYCNLRCTYCYEFSQLGDKTRISLHNIERMFEYLNDYVMSSGDERIDFVWHGGEPFLIPLDYYESIRALQCRVFGDRLQISNRTQTNLTILTVRHLEFIKSGTFFDDFGVSFDVFGDQRIDTQGKLRTESVIRNIQSLIDHGVSFGAITVLARDTLPHARQIFKFWNQLEIGFRMLPFHLSESPSQSSRHALTDEELVDSLNQLFDDWLASDNAILCDPVGTYLNYAIAHCMDAEIARYDKVRDERIFIVNTDGGVYGNGVGEVYGADMQYGNIFREGFETILTSANRQRIVTEAERRTTVHCNGCAYRRHCPGDYVADASAEEIATLERSGCTLRKVLDHMTTTLRKDNALAELLASRQLEQSDTGQLVRV
jgi:uncharacterized protein